MPRSDAELWQLVLDGDSGAWRELIIRYQALVYAIPGRMGLSFADIADCFQNTWVALYQNRKRISNPERLSAWLTTTAKREALRLKYMTVREGDENGLEQVPDHGLLPDEELQEIEKQAQLEIALEKIDLRCRQLLRQFFFAPEPQSYEEIAMALGIPANSLGPNRRRCLEKIKKILIEMGYLDVRESGDGSL